MEERKTVKVEGKPKGDIKYKILPIVSILSFLLIWQVVVELELVNTSAIATPLEVFSAFVRKLVETAPDGRTIQTNIFVSLQVSSVGLILAIILGTPLGLLMGWYKPIDRMVRPLFEIIRPIPPIAWIPLTLLWIGIGLGARGMIVFFAAFTPCLINAYTGIQQTNVTLINVAKTYGATNYQMFRKVGVPSAMPMAFAGIRIAISNAWGTLVAAELLAANAGIGYMIAMGRQFVRPDIIVLGMVVIGAIGYILNAIFIRVENIVVKWRTL